MRKVQVTPLVGQSISGAVCSLLEVDEYRILLDCGYDPSRCSREQMRQLANKVGHIDLILISHGDVHHMGSLPLLVGDQPVPVVCTLPVFKFGRMMLYDLHLNTELEGNPKSSSEMFTLNEIDASLSTATTVKFSQTLRFRSGEVGDSRNDLSFTAYPSGRTIGGSVWVIKCGAIEIVYAVDVNLKGNENIIDAISFQNLPTSPSLLIIEGGLESRVIGETVKKRREKEVSLLDVSLETLRNEGGVLIPCETASRTLELLHIFDKHWNDNKGIGIYHLVYFTHMATHVVDYARSQLEWMRDSASKGFYQDKPKNPFDLTNVKIVKTLKEFNAIAGPKVVFCTDSSLNCGLAKEVLLRWSGDPRNKVLFPDYPDKQSLAYTLLSQSASPPVIANVTHPERVMISGDELLRHLELVSKEERAREVELQRIKLEDELMKVFNYFLSYAESGTLSFINY
jgi:cleavage and polyadenylation specificity factor subunit 2